MGHTCALVSWGEQEAAVEEIEVGPAKHLALEHLEAIDMALDRAIGPGHGHTRFDGVIVLVEPFGKALQGLQRTGGSPLQPRIEALGLALAYQGGKVLREVDRLGHLRILRVELGELVVYLPNADKYRRLTRRPPKGQKVL